MREYRTFDSVTERYGIREGIIITDRDLASYGIHEKKGVFLVVAIRRNSKPKDFSMPLDRGFICNKRGILSGMKDTIGKYLYMYEDTSMRAEEETNMIKKTGKGSLNRQIS